MEFQKPDSNQPPTVGINQPSDPIDRIPNLIRDEDVSNMIQVQASAIERLEATNKSLTDCNALAQAKMNSTSKLFKKTAKQLSDSKKDLDYIYKKILDLKTKIKAEKTRD